MIRHVAGIAEIVDDLDAAVRFYREALGLAVEPKPGGGYAEVKLAGVLHFGLWERAHAARSTGVAPEQVPLGFTIGFEVDRVDDAASALGASGVRLVQAPHDEPWGQRTARFATPSGMFCEVSETPWARSVPGPDRAQPGS
jgi:catechol 2,3-dioxygenase-like lactoylglutathione lyase family enzyme